MEKSRLCIVRTYSAGVFAGYIYSKSKDGKHVVLKHAIRLWSWRGAASLSQLAMEGVKSPTECKFAVPVEVVELMEAIEIIPCSDRATKIIREVPSWKM